MHDPVPRTVLLERLLLILARLHTESEGYFDHPEQEQLWYNRGYADGMLQALRDLGYAAAIQGRIPADIPTLPVGVEVLSWGRAYLHGQQMGGRETREVLAPSHADL
jgi:hypothetical protein